MGHLPEEPLQDPQQTAQRVQALVGHQYCSPQDTVFYIEGQTLSWNDRNLTILDDHGKHAFTMENKAWRLRGNKVLKDIEGRSVCSLREKVFSRKSIWTICTGSNTDEASAIGTFTREYGTSDGGGTAKLVGHQGATFTLHARTRWAETIGLWLANLFHETEYDMLQQGKIVGQVYSYRHSYSQAGQQQAASMTDTSGSGQNDQLHLSKTPHNLNAVAVAATKP